MWGMVLVLALGAATDPVRFGIAVLLISRPEPLLNLLAYLLGGLATGIAASLGVLILLRDFATTLAHNVTSAVSIFTGGYVKITVGVLALLIAARMAVGFAARQRAVVPAPASGPSHLVLKPRTPTAFSQLSARLRHALDGGSLWVAFVVGIGSATPPVEYLLVLTAILASGAAIGTQLGAAVVYSLIIFSVIEIPLISYLVMPTRTKAAMLQLHNWVKTRRQRVLAVVLALAGVLLVTTGMSNI